MRNARPNESPPISALRVGSKITLTLIHGSAYMYVVVILWERLAVHVTLSSFAPIDPCKLARSGVRDPPKMRIQILLLSRITYLVKCEP